MVKLQKQFNNAKVLQRRYLPENKKSLGNSQLLVLTLKTAPSMPSLMNCFPQSSPSLDQLLEESAIFKIMPVTEMPNYDPNTLLHLIRFQLAPQQPRLHRDVRDSDIPHQLQCHQQPFTAPSNPLHPLKIVLKG